MFDKPSGLKGLSNPTETANRRVEVIPMVARRKLICWPQTERMCMQRPKHRLGLYAPAGIFSLSIWKASGQLFTNTGNQHTCMSCRGNVKSKVLCPKGSEKTSVWLILKYTQLIKNIHAKVLKLNLGNVLYIC